MPILLIGRSTPHIVLAPPDLRMIDPYIAREFCEGRYPLAGTSIDLGKISPFTVYPPNIQWIKALHSFRWLRHMRAVETPHAIEHARILVKDWIKIHSKASEGSAWELDVVAKRVISWMQHSGILLRHCDIGFYRLFLKSLSYQLRYLKLLLPFSETNEIKLRGAIALNFAALSLPTDPQALKKAIDRLEYELKHQILPDGLHISRNPELIIEVLTDLLPLRQTYTTQSITPPLALISAIERMMPALRFFRHRDGTLAHFNGTGYMLQERMSAVMRYDDSGGKPLSCLPHSGYQRLNQGTVTVIADTGRTPPIGARDKAHAGCLSFEMSSGRHRYIVNSGTYNYGLEEWNILARTTAAHSTATINDRSSYTFYGKHSFMSELSDVAAQRINDSTFIASHKGYHLTHSRRIEMLHNGSSIHGTDQFLKSSEEPIPIPQNVTIRFHLHPNVTPSVDKNHQITLEIERGDVWNLSCDELLPEIEDSLFFAGISGPQKTKMIVLKFDANHINTINWKLIRVKLGE